MIWIFLGLTPSGNWNHVSFLYSSIEPGVFSIKKPLAKNETFSCEMVGENPTVANCILVRVFYGVTRNKN